MKKAFISQLMAGKTNNQIRLERLKVMQKLQNMGYYILNSIIEEEPSEDITNPGVWYISKSLEILSQADIVYFMSGWENGRGCRIERAVAQEYEIPILEEGEEL